MTQDEVKDCAQKHRDDCEHLIAHIVDHYVTIHPRHFMNQSDLAAHVLRRAFDTACQLDRAAATLGRPARFLCLLIDSIFNDRRFVSPFYLMMRFTLRTAAILQNEAESVGMRTEDKATAQFITERRHLGWSSRSLKDFYQEELLREFNSDSPLEKSPLHHAIHSNLPKPGATNLLIHAWLPLALWQTEDGIERAEDGIEREERILDAWTICKNKGVPVPNWPDPLNADGSRIEAFGPSPSVRQWVRNARYKLNHVADEITGPGSSESPSS